MQIYKSKINTVVAVERTTLDIYRDQITVIVGENGAGKTTTMDMIVGKFSLFSNNSDHCTVNCSGTYL